MRRLAQREKVAADGAADAIRSFAAQLCEAYFGGEAGAELRACERVLEAAEATAKRLAGGEVRNLLA